MHSAATETSVVPVAPSESIPDKAPSKPSLGYRAWSVLPGPLRRGARAAIIYKRMIGNYWYDLRRYATSSSSITKEYPQENYRALITMDYHRLEKGMALPEPRMRFGAAVLHRLKRDLPTYIERFGHDHTTDVAFNALREYVEMHRARDIAFPEISAFIEEHARGECDVAPGVGGTRPMTRAELQAATDFDVDRFFLSRHSIRQYTDRPVERELIERAIRLAMKTPSVCNRQSWRVWHFTARERIDEMLSYQDGNRGFGDHAPALLIITADMRAFTKAGERNQCWIDGGMFSGSLVLALHAVGLGSCCLNWSVEHGRDVSMRKAAGIPDTHAVMMMLSVGHIPEELPVAQSPRRPIGDVLIPDAQSH